MMRSKFVHIVGLLGVSTNYIATRQVDQSGRSLFPSLTDKLIKSKTPKQQKETLEDTDF